MAESKSKPIKEFWQPYHYATVGGNTSKMFLLPVPTGWLVYFGSGNNNVTFVPDENHIWHPDTYELPSIYESLEKILEPKSD